MSLPRRLGNFRRGRKGKLQDDEKNKCFSWEGDLKWTGNNGCGEPGAWHDKVQVGQMYGLSKGDAKGFKKLKGFVEHI